MITLVVGENSFENERVLQRIAVSFKGDVERVDGSELELKQLPDLLMGAMFFADKRLVVVRNLSENKALWGIFGEWLKCVHDDTHLVLVETKPDKRTKTYKDLQKVATTYESRVWTERDTAKAEQWVIAEAVTLGFVLDKKSAHALVARVGVDQWLLYQALQKLMVTDNISPETIEALIEASPTENVFNLLDGALRGNVPKIKQLLEVLAVTEDPYRLFGLLNGQVFQLVVLSVTDKPSADVAKDIGAHPFVLSKLAPYAKKLGKTGARKVVVAFSEADASVKTSAGDPWLLIERALIKVARI